MGPDLELQKWIALYSLIYFWDYFWGIIMFLSFVSNLVYQNNNYNNRTKKIYLDCWVIKCPSCSHPPSLPGWRSQPVSAFGSWHAGRFSSRSIWLAGRIPRQWCWQLPLGLASAGAEDMLLGHCMSSHVHWGHGTAWAAAVLTLSLLLLPPEQQIPGNPGSWLLWFGWVLVALCQWLYVFYSGGPE